MFREELEQFQPREIDLVKTPGRDQVRWDRDGHDAPCTRLHARCHSAIL